MIIDTDYLCKALLRNGKTKTDLREILAPTTIANIWNHRPVQIRTFRKLAEWLQCEAVEMMEDYEKTARREGGKA